MQVSKPKKGYKKIKWNYSKEIIIPEEWEILTLGQVSKQIQDADHKVPKKTKFGVPFLTVNDIARNEKIDFSKCSFVSEADYLEFIKKIKPEKNDILYTRVATIGTARLIQKTRKMVISSNAVVIKLKNSIVSAFLKEQLNNSLIKNNLESQKAGTTYNFLSLSEIRKINLIIPSVDEQQKIASILSNIDNTLEKTNQLIHKTELLKKGLVQKLFTEGIGHTKFKKVKLLFDKEIEIPKDWVISKIGDLFEIRGGIQKTPKRKPLKNYYPYLRVGNVFQSRLDLTQIEYFEITNNELEQLRLNFGDLLVVEGNGNQDQIGRTAIWHDEIQNCIHQNHIIRCRPSEKINSNFVSYFLNSSIGRRLLNQIAITTSGLYTLSVGKLSSLPIPLLSLSEQQQIVSILSNVDSQVTKEKLQKSNLEILKKGLMQKLLTGQIRVKV